MTVHLSSLYSCTAIKNLQRKKCLITGAASGIGKATALAAAREKAELFLTDINEASLNSVAEECESLGARVSSVKAFDISNYEAVKAWAIEIHGTHTSLDVLMNIAGISIWGTVENLTHEQWRRTVDINLMGPIHIIENFIPPMIAAKNGGHLVNVSSAAGLFGLRWHAAYSASKFGLRGISEVLLIGAYEMLAAVINSTGLGLEPEAEMTLAGAKIHPA
ncbi:MAG: SDR family NAD(P)-dependent oxidoreductase [Turneriella sp.]